MIFRAFLFTLSISFSPIVFAQAPSPPQKFVMNFDYSRFRSNGGASYVELYYSFYCGLVTYRSNGTNLQGGVALRTDLINTATGKAVINERLVVPVVLEDTSMASWRSLPVLRQAGHLVPAGNYRLHVVAYDSLNPARRDSLSVPLEVKSFSGRPALSDLELCSLIQATTNQNQPYYKNAHEVLPHPSLVFGVLTPVIYTYSELYDLDTAKVYTVNYEIIGTDGVVAKKVSRQRRYRTANTIEVGTLNAVALKPGKYVLNLSVQASTGSAGTQAAARKEFHIYQSPAAVGETAPTATALAVAIEALTEKQVDEEFQKAKYLADKTEIYFFSQLKTLQAKKDYLKDFWNRRETSPEAEQRRLRGDYLRRVEAASERYSSYTKKGWRTDRGRVFILYGKPDETERHQSEGSSKPYEIWRYFQIENNVEFVFVDKNGFGDYELVHSTKRGELRDDGWDRFLQ